jgi:capsular polysaccharide transport system permease protein
MDYPTDILEVLFAWGLLCWLGTALAVFIGALGAYNEIAERLWHPIAYILFPLSGAVFMVDWLPKEFQDIVLLNPIVHCVELLREGYFGNVVRTHYDISYVVGFCLALTLLGLAFTRSAESRMEILG